MCHTCQLEGKNKVGPGYSLILKNNYALGLCLNPLLFTRGVFLISNEKGEIIEMTRYQKFLLLTFAVVWTWAAINPKFPHDWLL